MTVAADDIVNTPLAILMFPKQDKYVTDVFSRCVCERYLRTLADGPLAWPLAGRTTTACLPFSLLLSFI